MKIPGSWLRIVLATLAVAATGTVAAENWERRDLYSFGQRDPQGGRLPENAPILGADGALYGVTRVGGTFGKGVIYRFDPANGSYVVLRHFIGAADGASPMGSAFLQATDGRLYGLALNPRLILYSITTDGSDYRIHFAFPPGSEQGGVQTHVNTLTLGPDGLIYGIFITGGSGTPPSLGTLFRIARDGSDYQVLGTVLSPTSALSFGAKGQLFGTTFGTVYRLERDGSGFTTLITFPLPQVGTEQAEGGVLAASDGFLYGQTNRGGAHNFGYFFRLAEDGSAFQVLFNRTVLRETGHLRGPAFESNDGFIYGATGEDGFGTESFVWRIRKDGTGWQVLHRRPFLGRGTDAVVQGADGFLYGCTTAGPGGHDLFRLARDGSSFSLAHTFPSTEGFPLTPIALVRGADQNLYGLLDRNGTGGRGTLFRIKPDGSGFAIRHDFGTGTAADHATGPKALAAGPDGNLYGVFRQRGSAGAGVFRFDPVVGTFAWLHTFEAGVLADSATVLVGADGLLYGAIDTAAAKTGRIFRVTTEGAGFTILRTLSGSAPSFTGTAALTEGEGSLLYGVTTRNGTSTVPLLFRIARDGSAFQALTDITVGANPTITPPFGLLAHPTGKLYGFASNVLFSVSGDGAGLQTLHTFSNSVPLLRPLAGFDGKIYGAYPFGGPVTRGAIFRINPNGSGFEEVATFTNAPMEGQAPLGFLVTAPDGSFCGLTPFGGEANRGTLFRVATPEQIVGIAGESLGFDANGRFRGTVVGPSGRPVDVWQSDDLQTWQLLQRVKAPDADPTFIDPIVPLPPHRFYRATAP